MRMRKRILLYSGLACAVLMLAPATTAVAETGAIVAPEKAASKKGASPKKDAPKGQKTAKAAKPKPAKKERKSQHPEQTAAREGTAKAKVIAMLPRKGGASLDSIMKETGWQAHTCRGFISILGSKHGLKIESSKRESDGARVYSLAE